LLDVGCGNRIYTLSFANHAGRVLGIDINKKALHDAVQNKRGCGASNVDFALMSVEALGTEKINFDVVVSIETLEHFQNETAALSNIRRVLRHSGRLVLYVPNKLYPFETHGIRIGTYVIDQPLIPFFSYVPNIMRRRFERARIYSSKELQRLLQRSGFRIDVVDYLFLPLDKVKRDFVKKSLRKFFSILEKTRLRMFGMSIFVVATKQRLPEIEGAFL
jgi:2-polyprenyl-3-methyl-5-hydroxy-6-metoxy-1,4-benzoquinol methylase